MQNILISGTTSGIGTASARLFHRRGWRIGLLDIDAEALHGLATQLPGTWQRAMDVSGPDAVGKMLAQFCTDGHLRLLLSCASIPRFGRFEEIALEDRAWLLAINLQGVLNCCHAAFPFLHVTPQAQVLNMGSAPGLYGVPEMTVYSTSKFAVHGLTRMLELEWRRRGVRVTGLMLPFIRMPMIAGQTYRPPVLRHLGLRLDAKNITEAAWRQAYSRRVHRPVSRLFTTLYWAGQLSPPWVNRAMMAWLPRDEQALAFIRRLSGVLADTAYSGIHLTGPGNADCHSSSVGRIAAHGYPPLIRDIGR